MNYQQFVMALKEKVSFKLGQNVDVQIHTALKNNGYERVGLTISEKHINLSPTIYLEEYFKHFEEDDSIDDIAESILQSAAIFHLNRISSYIRRFFQKNCNIFPKNCNM